MRRRRELTAEELALWQRAMGVSERRDQARATPRPAGDAAEPKPVGRRIEGALSVRRQTPALDPDRPIDLDRRSWLRLKRGQVTLDDTLDLHGQTQEQAHGRLGRFLAAAQAQGRRCVLVVTGKGRLERGGVLRHMVPRWLNEGGNRERVLAYCPAQRQHGGDGALYVLIRRPRASRLPNGGGMLT
jgi:DNA-nicking Smr family endonuclease